MFSHSECVDKFLTSIVWEVLYNLVSQFYLSFYFRHLGGRVLTEKFLVHSDWELCSFISLLHSWAYFVSENVFDDLTWCSNVLLLLELVEVWWLVLWWIGQHFMSFSLNVPIVNGWQRNHLICSLTHSLQDVRLVLYGGLRLVTMDHGIIDSFRVEVPLVVFFIKERGYCLTFIFMQEPLSWAVLVFNWSQVALELGTATHVVYWAVVVILSVSASFRPFVCFCQCIF